MTVSVISMTSRRGSRPLDPSAWRTSLTNDALRRWRAEMLTAT